MALWKKNLILLAAAALICAAPLIFVKNGEFSGADSQAGDVIAEIAPEYEPWFNPLIELPSGEVESLLFALQAAIGAGVVGFILGRLTSGQKNEKKAGGKYNAYN